MVEQDGEYEVPDLNLYVYKQRHLGRVSRRGIADSLTGCLCYPGRVTVVLTMYIRRNPEQSIFERAHHERKGSCYLVRPNFGFSLDDLFLDERAIGFTHEPPPVRRQWRIFGLAESKLAEDGTYPAIIIRRTSGLVFLSASNLLDGQEGRFERTGDVGERLGSPTSVVDGCKILRFPLAVTRRSCPAFPRTGCSEQIHQTVTISLLLSGDTTRSEAPLNTTTGNPSRWLTDWLATFALRAYL